jgi:hypothetical protein
VHVIDRPEDLRVCVISKRCRTHCCLRWRTKDPVSLNGQYVQNERCTILETTASETFGREISRFDVAGMGVGDEIR